MSRWDFERLQMLIGAHQASRNPLGFIFGMFAIGMFGGIYLWLQSVSNIPDKPKELKTATDYVEWGNTLIANKKFKLSQTEQQQRKANCANAILYFDKALTLDPKTPDAYEGRGSALICQGNYQAGISELKKAKNLYLTQGNESKAKLMDTVINTHKKLYSEQIK